MRHSPRHGPGGNFTWCIYLSTKQPIQSSPYYPYYWSKAPPALVYEKRKGVTQPRYFQGFPRDFSRCDVPRDSGQSRDPVEIWKSRSRPSWSRGNVRDPDPVPCFFLNPDPVQTSPVKIGQIPWNVCPVPCKPVKFEISQIPSKPVPWFRDHAGFIPWFMIKRNFPGS